MNYKLDHGAHAVYTLQYHLIFVIKYRRKVLDSPPLIEVLRTKCFEVSQTFEVKILALEPERDHIHLFFKAKPTLGIPQYINALKTLTSREIRR